MKVTGDDVQRMYQRMTARGGGADCLGEETLMRVACGEADRDERERAVAHIAGCSDCAREYQIARSLRPLRAPRRPQRLVWSLAAMLALAIGAIVWMAVQRPRVVVVERPGPAPRSVEVVREDVPIEIGMPIVDLDADATRGAPSAEAKVALPRGVDLYTLILHLPAGFDGAVDVVVDDRASQRTTSTDGAVTLTLNRRIAGIGRHAVHVRSGEKTVDFSFVVAEP